MRNGEAISPWLGVSMEVLSANGISKNFGPLWANKNITFHVDEGEIVSLLGENGAGKTTLMNILYGLYQPTEGYIKIRGKERRIGSPREAIDLGISMVHQHFMLVDALTVTENIILGNEPRKGIFTDSSLALGKVSELSEKYGLGLDCNAEVGTLSVGEKQKVELLKALYNDCSVLILDEPTAVLTPLEVEAFFRILQRLRENGKGIILISHKLKETLTIADRIYIIRAGEIVAETTCQGASVESLAELMVGHALDSKIDRNETDDNETVLRFSEVSCREKGRNVIDGISLSVRRGRILGIAGVDGNGQTELSELALGVRKVSDGMIEYHGGEIRNTRVRRRILDGIGYVPEDRQKKGLVNAFTVEDNLILGYEDDARFSRHGIINWHSVDSYADSVISEYDIRCQNRDEKAGALSGGNQQKIVIGRVLEANPDVIIASQPTRGVDIGAVEYIHKKLIEMRNRGKAIMLVSADLDEIMKLSDEIAVIYDGRIVSCAANGKYTKTELGEFMTGAREGDE